MAIGRVGCFFAGCCSGRPSAAFWAVWSTDQRVGVRRIPTQLMESLLALIVGAASLAAFLTHGPANGAIFVAAAAGYTLIRQGILLLRSEGRKSVVGPPLTAATAALLLVADLALVALSATGRIALPGP
jgi:phosphatidylglycerol:prolipoprotein diacylglycerol transferase